MSNESQWVELENSELLSGLSQLVRRGNELTAELLGYLAEVEQRMLYAVLGFPSLHAYCVRELRMSEGAAGRRVTAARVCSRFPKAFELVARGELHLSALCALGSHLTPENADELLPACSGKTRRQSDEWLAARFPRPDVREQVRRLPGRELEPLSEARFGVHFTADAELTELLERARDLARHRLPSGDLAGLIKLALATFVRAEEKRRFGVGSRARRSKATPPGGATSVTPPGGVSNARTSPAGTRAMGTRSRYVRMAERREVFARDQAQCTFVARDGRRCRARGWLELDHREPWARLGESGAVNLRLRCRAHNLLHARACFGAIHVAAKVAARRAAP